MTDGQKKSRGSAKLKMRSKLENGLIARIHMNVDRKMNFRPLIRIYDVHVGFCQIHTMVVTHMILWFIYMCH